MSKLQLAGHAFNGIDLWFAFRAGIHTATSNKNPVVNNR